MEHRLSAWRSLLMGALVAAAAMGIWNQVSPSKCASAAAECPVGSTSVFSQDVGIQGGTAFTTTVTASPTVSHAIDADFIHGILVPQAYGAIADGTTDDAVALAATISALGVDGGQIDFQDGVYKSSTALNWGIGDILQGRGVQVSTLDYSGATGNFLTGVSDPDWAVLRDMEITGSGGSTGWAIYSNAGSETNRQQLLSNINIGSSGDGSHFKNGIFLDNTIAPFLEHIQAGGGTAPAGSVGVQLGQSGSGGNGGVILGAYINHFETGISLWSQNYTLISPIIEANGTGILNNGTGVIISPWYTGGAGANTLYDIDAQTPINVIGYGSGNWNINFPTSTIKNRSIIIPERNDRARDSVTNGGPAGIKLGQFYVLSDGSLEVLDGAATKPTFNVTSTAIKLGAGGTDVTDIALTRSGSGGSGVLTIAAPGGVVFSNKISAPLGLLFANNTRGALTIGGFGDYSFTGTVTGAIDTFGVGMRLGGVTAAASNTGPIADLYLRGSTLTVTDGAHALGATLMIAARSTKAGSGTITDGATIYIAEAFSGATTGNYSLWVDAGNVQFDGGLIVGAPTGTGGTFAAGRIGAEAVYDDNVLLTDYVSDAYKGLLTKNKVAYYSSLIPPWVHAAELDPDTKAVKKARETIIRVHQPAIDFEARGNWVFDPAQYGQYFLDTGHLVNMPSLNDWVAGKRYSTGETIQKLQEAVEILTLQNYDMANRLTILEGGVK